MCLVVHPCSFYLEVTKEQVELLCLHSTAVGQAAGVALPGDVMCPLPCPERVQVAKVVLDPLLVGCFSIPDALLQVCPCFTVVLRVTRLESGVAGLQQELYVLGHPRLVIRKHADLFCGGDIVHAAFYVEQDRGGVSINAVILKYGPDCATETVLQLLRSPLWSHLYGSSSWFDCVDKWSICWSQKQGYVVRLSQMWKR